jgi:hypothetical protein
MAYMNSARTIAYGEVRRLDHPFKSIVTRVCQSNILLKYPTDSTPADTRIHQLINQILKRISGQKTSPHAWIETLAQLFTVTEFAPV